MSQQVSCACVVGMGEVGRRLATALASAGVKVLPVTRVSGWDEALADNDAPMLMCVREEALPELLARVGGVAPERLVFVQNGWVRPLLAGLSGCTRGLIWFTSKGEFFRVLRASVLSGPQATRLASALGRGGVPAVAVGGVAFASAEAEKMGFNCVVGLPLAVHRVSLSEYLARFEDEAHVVFGEALQFTARALGANLPAHAWEEFVRVCEPIGWVRTATAKALAYRNGAVIRLARELGGSAPVNQRLLEAVGFRA